LKTSILTTSEFEWLTGKKKISKIYEYRIKSDIKKKLQIFQNAELPLLAQNGFLNDLSIFTQLSANTQDGTKDQLGNSTQTEHKKVLRPGFEPGIVALRGRNA
jgi:hypothetical protein